MRKILSLIITVAVLPLMLLDVNAISTSIGWNYEHNYDNYPMIGLNPQNTDVPAYLEWDGENKYTLHLNNYNGPGLVFGQAAVGDTSNVEVVINLTGTNTISSNNVGIDLWVSNNKPITFTGTGTLKLNARIPMSNDVSKTFIDPSNDNKVDNTVEETVDEDLEEDTADNTKEETNTENEDTLNYKTLFIISSVISVILAVVCLVLVFKPKKKNNPQ